MLAVGGVASSTAVLGSGDEDHEKSDDQKPHSNLTHGLSWDGDMDKQFDNQMRLDGDPAGSGRGHAVHFTSHGSETADISTTTVDVREHSLNLGNVSGSGRLAYDYYRGSDQTASTPGQVYLILRSKRGRNEGFHVAFRGSDDGAETDGWETRNVSRELTGSGWRTVSVDPGLVDMENETVTTSYQEILQHVQELQSQEQVDNLVGHLGGNAELLAVSIGTGHPMNPAVVDTYFDDLRVAGESHTVPAQITMTPSFERADGTVSVALSLENQAQGVGLENVEDGSVRLSRYAPIARPVPGTSEAQESAQATSVDAHGEQLTVHFDEDDVASALGESDTAMVYGSFDVAQPVTFLAVGSPS